jgi:Bacterial Ig-like domain (group 3)
MRSAIFALLAAAASLLLPATALAYGPTDPAVPYVQSLPFLAGGAFSTNMESPSVQVDPNSAAYVSDLVNLVNADGAFVTDGYQGGDPICLTTSSTTIPMYAPNPKTPLAAAFLQGVPIPLGCEPDATTDATMTVYDPSTHQLWTTWQTSTPVENEPGCTDTLPWGHACYGDGQWHFNWGGEIANVTTSPGYFDYQSLPGSSSPSWGTSATSTVNAARTILASEVLSGTIPHAVALASSASLNCADDNRWPAQRNDGISLSALPGCIPEGTFFRINPAVNLASLNLPTFTLMVAKAAQQYGICLCESTSGGPTLQMENTTQYGYDAWTASALLFGQCRWEAMRSFPWADLQVIAAPTRVDGSSGPASSTITATPTSATVPAGSPVQVNLSVNSASGAAAPGAVYLRNASGTQLQAAMLNDAAAPSTATLSITPPAPGTYTYTIAYGGDETVLPSSATVTVTAQ